MTQDKDQPPGIKPKYKPGAPPALKVLDIEQLEDQYSEALDLWDIVWKLHREVDRYLSWATPAEKKRGRALKAKVKKLVRQLHDGASRIMLGLVDYDE
jgi:hypothetical protein